SSSASITKRAPTRCARHRVAVNSLLVSLVIRAVNQAGSAFNQANRQMKDMQDRIASLNKAGKDMMRGGAAMVGTGLGVAYGLKEMVAPGMEVEYQLGRIKT